MSTNKEKDMEKEDPIKKLEEIEDKYSSIDDVDAPESLGLEKREFEDLSEDEILETAKEKVGDKESGKKVIEDDYLKKIEVLSGKKDEATKQSEVNKEQINLSYDNNTKNISDQALKRGLARSSIVINQLANVESKRAEALAGELDSINNKYAQIENEINELAAKKETALDEFELAYAKTLEKAIVDKKNELEKQRQEVIEFNNKVDELEAEYKLSLDKQKQAAAKANMEMKEKYGYTANDIEMANEKYKYMISYIDTLEKNEAINMLLNDEKLQKLLGDKFMAVYAYARNRK